MDRFFPFRLTLAAAGLAAFSPLLSAQPRPASNLPPILAPSAQKPEKETSPEPSAPKRARAVSSDVAAALAAAAPKYTPAPPKPEPLPEEEKPDLRETDRPKNEIIRLPKVYVREPKPAVLRERSVNTEKGLKDIAMRRYLTDADRALNLVSLPFFSSLAEQRALAMYAEDERLQNMADLKDAANNASKSDPAAGAYIRRESDLTYLRTRDFGWSSTNK
jgi:hypothetical protein